MIMAQKWPASLVAVAFLLTGCTSVVAGAASVDRAELQQYQQDHGPLSAAGALGDLTTVDYCGLLDLARVGQAGAVDIGPATPSWNYCRAGAKIGGRKVTILVGFLVSVSGDARFPDPARKLDRGLVAEERFGSTEGRCARYLTFADGASLEADVTDEAAETSDLSMDAPMCAVAGAVLDGMVADVLARTVRHFTFAPGSLGTVDACSLVSDAAVAAQLGGPVDREPIPTKHRCVWNAGANWADIEFEVGAAPVTTTDTIGGHRSLVAAKTPGCGATTTVAPSSSAPGSSEIAVVLVYTPGHDKDPCAIATALAGMAWPKLPAS
jgi:hypothetical protein